MTSEKSKEEYYRDAAQYLNTGERVISDSGEVSGTLAFLTRGRNYIFFLPNYIISNGFARHPPASDGLHGRRHAFF